MNYLIAETYFYITIIKCSNLTDWLTSTIAIAAYIFYNNRSRSSSVLVIWLLFLFTRHHDSVHHNPKKTKSDYDYHNLALFPSFCLLHYHWFPHIIKKFKDRRAKYFTVSPCFFGVYDLNYKSKFDNEQM